MVLVSGSCQHWQLVVHSHRSRQLAIKGQLRFCICRVASTTGPVCAIYNIIAKIVCGKKIQELFCHEKIIFANRDEVKDCFGLKN